MVHPVLVFILAFVGSSYAAIESPYCIKLQKCPLYTDGPLITAISPLLKGGYVRRTFEPSIWIETHRQDAEERQRDMFQRLFFYINSNQGGLSPVKMNSPVVGIMKIEEPVTKNVTKTMRLYLGPDDHSREEYPAPALGRHLHLHHDPKMTFYVHKFTMDDNRDLRGWNSRAKALRQEVGVTHKEYIAANYRTANEIWIHTSDVKNDRHYLHHTHGDSHDHHHGDHHHNHNGAHGHDHGGHHNGH